MEEEFKKNFRNVAKFEVEETNGNFAINLYR